MPAIVQINFPYAEDQSTFEAQSTEVAGMFTGVDGLQWKIWLVDEASKTAGGIYLFESRAQADSYARGDLVNHLKSIRQGVSVNVFDTIIDAGKITGAPV